MIKRKNLVVLSFLVLACAVIAAGYYSYPRIYNDYLSNMDTRRTAEYYEPGDCWRYTYPDVQKMSLRAVAYCNQGYLWSECFYRATPEQKELLVAAFPYDGHDDIRDWLYELPRDEGGARFSNTRRCLEIMHVIPASDKHLTLEKAYEILSSFVPRLVSKLDKKDALALQTDPSVEQGKLTRYEVWLKILKRLNAYSICEDRSYDFSAEYDLTDDGNLCLVVVRNGHFGLSAYVKDKSNSIIRYLLFSDVYEQLKESYDLTYFIPLDS